MRDSGVKAAPGWNRRKRLLVQCAKKILSDSKGLEDFPVKLVDSVDKMSWENCLWKFKLEETRIFFFFWWGGKLVRMIFRPLHIVTVKTCPKGNPKNLFSLHTVSVCMSSHYKMKCITLTLRWNSRWRPYHAHNLKHNTTVLVKWLGQHRVFTKYPTFYNDNDYPIST